MKQKRSARGIFVGKPEGRTPRVRHRRKLKDNNKIHIGTTYLIHVAQDMQIYRSVAGSCERSNEYSTSIKYSDFMNVCVTSGSESVTST
jgi:hypothetical protein